MSWFRALWKVVGKYNAPALSSVPSMPSVSQAIADTRGRCCFDRSKSVMANARRNSVLRQPRPMPFTFTVVSPPESKTTGAGAGWLCRRT